MDEKPSEVVGYLRKRLQDPEQVNGGDRVIEAQVEILLQALEEMDRASMHLVIRVGDLDDVFCGLLVEHVGIV